METCNNEIQISFSPPEFEVVCRAVAKFSHVDRSGTRSLNHLDHAKKVIRILKEKLPVRAASKRRFPMSAEMRKADKYIQPVTQMGDSLFHRLISNLKCCNRIKKSPVLYERCFINKRRHGAKILNLQDKGAGKCYVVSRRELEKIM